MPCTHPSSSSAGTRKQSRQASQDTGNPSCNIHFFCLRLLCKVKIPLSLLCCVCAGVQVPWALDPDDALQYSCVVEALLAAWVAGDLPPPAAQASIPYAHQASQYRTLTHTLSEATTVRHAITRLTMLCIRLSTSSPWSASNDGFSVVCQLLVLLLLNAAGSRGKRHIYQNG